jgi:hypothetical protein
MAASEKNNTIPRIRVEGIYADIRNSGRRLSEAPAAKRTGTTAASSRAVVAGLPVQPGTELQLAHRRQDVRNQARRRVIGGPIGLRLVGAVQSVEGFESEL